MRMFLAIADELVAGGRTEDRLDKIRKKSRQSKAHVGRPPRIDLDLPLNFAIDQNRINGRTVNVSESGLLVVFEKPVELWMVGKIAMTVGPYYIELEARVARCLSDGCGLSFLITSDNDRRAANILNEYAFSLLTGIPMPQPEDS